MLVDPSDNRTKTDKIKAAGLTERTFYRWMSDTRYISYVNSLTDKYTNAALPGAWKALIRQCDLGNIQAIKFLFELKRMNPAINDKLEIELQRLEIERAKLAIMEAKASGGSEDIPDDGFLEALEAAVPNIWGDKPCP